MRTRTTLGMVFSAAAIFLLISPMASAQGALSSQEELGRLLFFDTNLSDPAGQACAACHGPSVGYTGPDQAINAAGAVYEGAVTDRFGNRKPPAAAYAGDSPILFYDTANETWVGGMFWDGRATGWTLGDPLAEQALGPLTRSQSDALEVLRRSESRLERLIEDLLQFTIATRGELTIKLSTVLVQTLLNDAIAQIDYKIHASEQTLRILAPAGQDYVKCDEELNPAASRDMGRLIIEIGMSPVKPAEFVIFRIGQWTAEVLAVTRTGQVVSREREDMVFGYRQSSLDEPVSPRWQTGH